MNISKEDLIKCGFAPQSSIIDILVISPPTSVSRRYREEVWDMERKAFRAFYVRPIAAHAYIGPGMGLGVIGVVLGILLAIVLAFFAILWYSVKRLFAKSRTLKKQKPSDTEDRGKAPS